VPPARGGGHGIRHQEEVISVFVDLCALVRLPAVLDRERMKSESLLQEVKVGIVTQLKVDPAHFAIARRHGTIGAFEYLKASSVDSNGAEHPISKTVDHSARRALMSSPIM
jgi:hypothetical protein